MQGYTSMLIAGFERVPAFDKAIVSVAAGRGITLDAVSVRWQGKAWGLTKLLRQRAQLESHAFSQIKRGGIKLNYVRPGRKIAEAAIYFCSS